MDFSLSSLFEWTKLFVRDPRMAASLVKDAKLPIEVSILMIVLAGVVSAAVSGFHYVLIGAPEVVIPISETEGLQVDRVGPIWQGIFAVASGVGLAYIMAALGRWFGGEGSLADIMGITAILQLVTTLIFAASYMADLFLPIVAVMLAVLGFYVSFRGLGHTVNVGHSFENMGKSAGVAFLSLILLGFVLIFGSAMLGLAPDSKIVPLELEQTL